MSGHVAGAQLAGDVATCAVVVALLDICAELGNYCGEHGNCQPGLAIALVSGARISCGVSGPLVASPLPTVI